MSNIKSNDDKYNKEENMCTVRPARPAQRPQQQIDDSGLRGGRAGPQHRQHPAQSACARQSAEPRRAPSPLMCCRWVTGRVVLIGGPVGAYRLAGHCSTPRSQAQGAEQRPAALSRRPAASTG